MEISVISKETEESTGQPLVFVHGVCHAAWCWRKYLDYFAAHGHNCYALSLRGHGDSEGYERLDSFGLDDYVSDVEEVIKSVEGDPVLIGHSMGGAIVQKFLLNHQQEVAGAVLLASPPPTETSIIMSLKPWLRNFRGMFATMKLLRGKNISVNQVYRSVFFDRRVPKTEVREYAERLQPESSQAVEDLSGRIIPEEHGITASVFVLGSKSDNLFAEPQIKMTADAFDVEPVLLDKPCHDIMLDPLWERSAQHIKEFLVTIRQ